MRARIVSCSTESHHSERVFPSHGEEGKPEDCRVAASTSPFSLIIIDARA